MSHIDPRIQQQNIQTLQLPKHTIRKINDALEIHQIELHNPDIGVGIRALNFVVSEESIARLVTFFNVANREDEGGRFQTKKLQRGFVSEASAGTGDDDCLACEIGVQACWRDRFLKEAHVFKKVADVSNSDVDEPVELQH